MPKATKQSKPDTALLSAMEKMLIKTVQRETKKIIQTETRKIVQEETLAIVQTETRKIIQEETRNIVKEEIKPLVEEMDSFKEVQDKHTGMLLDLQDSVESIDHRLTTVESQQIQMIDTMEGIAKKVDRHDAEIAASLDNYDRLTKRLQLT
jgi:hypothetical protein